MSDSRELLRELAAVYAAEFPGKLAPARRALARLVAGQAEAAEELISCLHRLRGSAGSYGFHEASERAGVLEDELSSLVESGDTPLAAQAEALAPRLEAIAESVSSRESDPSPGEAC